jgi:hypothetical protein
MRVTAVIVLVIVSGCAHGVLRVGQGSPITTSGAVSTRGRHALEDHVAPRGPAAPPVRLADDAPMVYGRVPTRSLPSYARTMGCHAVFGRGPRYDDYQSCRGTAALEGPWPSVFTIPQFLRLDDGGDHAELHP